VENLEISEYLTAVRKMFGLLAKSGIIGENFIEKLLLTLHQGTAPVFSIIVVGFALLYHYY